MLQTSFQKSTRIKQSITVPLQFPKHRNSRPFAQRTRLLLLPPATPRPQLPFLYAPSRGSYTLNGKFQLSRLISTETQRTIRDTTYGGIKVYLVLTFATVCLFSVVVGVSQERLERTYPTPDGWRFFTRWAYRVAAALEDDEGKGSPPDWPQVGPAWRECLNRLEEIGKTDGQGLERMNASLELEDVPLWDATKKSEDWRRGYFEVVMGCGRAAEHLQGWFKDETRPGSRPVPADVIVGPSNLDPRPLPPEQGPAPREEHCKPVMEAPDVFYHRIINSKGFSRRQRLQAILALADFLDYQGNQWDAERYYRDGLDLASSAFSEPEKMVDRNLGVIKGEASAVSDNVLLASTALAVHYARNADTTQALPIFLSALRAIRECNSLRDSAVLALDSASTIPVKPRSWVDNMIDLVKDRPYPPPPPSGDEPLRASSESCLEATLLAYVGEILFATSKTNHDRVSGIAWTKDAADLAESKAGQISREQARNERLGSPQQRFLASRSHNDIEACQQCLETALTNLQTMLSQMTQKEVEPASQRESQTRSWFSWLSGNSRSEISPERWEEELADVNVRLEKFREERIHQMMTGQAGGGRAGLPRLR
ncbi:hypothetical protein EV356DRAFT_455058 [Viridothelium virens]|uniref:Uncharacterized protein n=1 Tax=Viridothelium virens TaxID=1048519 RepID=A0A6A6GVX6_VIRVR|nr:hypothetical protein EV356DRAFT_455058 [Viridothelium virens]